LIATSLVNFVDPALVHVNNKNNVVSETRYAVHCRHSDDEAEQIVYNSI